MEIHSENEYNQKDIDNVEKYSTYMGNYKEALCGLIDHVNTLNIIPFKMKLQIPFIKKYINNEENESEILENGIIHLYENKEIILNFNFDNLTDFSDHYKKINIKNDFIDMMDEFIGIINKNKNKILKKDIKLIKQIFEHIFDILENIINLF
jgi:hypothetical protein